MNEITLSPGLPGRRPAIFGPHALDFVRRACMRYVQNRDEAEDLAQEVFLKAAGGWRDFAGDSRPDTWLYRVAANHCLDHLRRQKRLRGLAELYAVEWREQTREPAAFANGWTADGRTDGWSDGRMESGADRMRRVLERLRAVSGETDRHVVYLRFDLDLTQSGIAEILGVTRTAVSQRLARIHARAREIWEAPP